MDLPVDFTPKVDFKKTLNDIRLDRAKYDFCLNPNFLSLFFYRIEYYLKFCAPFLVKYPWIFFVVLFRKFLFAYNHIEIHCAYRHSYIDGGCFLNHHSMVIYGRIGSDVSINSFVLIGAASGKRHEVTKSKYPIIGNNVMIGASANIIGPIIIGNDVKIGANATITKDVPDGATVTGINNQYKKTL